MRTYGARLLRESYGVADRKIDFIPHGIPLPHHRPSKDRLGVEGQSMLLTNIPQ